MTKNLSTSSAREIRYTGLGSAASAYLIAAIASRARGEQDRPLPSLVVVPNASIGEAVLQDLRFLLPKDVSAVSFFGWEVLPFDALSPAVPVAAERISTLAGLLREEPQIVVASVDGLQRAIASKEIFQDYALSLTLGEEIDRTAFIESLDRFGYIRASLVEECGQYAVRGAIVDVFPAGSSLPLRVELFGDAIESLRLFDPTNQRSVGPSENISLLPVREFFLPQSVESALPLLKERLSELSLPQSHGMRIEEALRSGSTYPGIEHLQQIFLQTPSYLWEYLPKDSPIIIWDDAAVDMAADEFSTLVAERAEQAEQLGQLFSDPQKTFLSADSFVSKLRDLRTHVFNSVEFLRDSDFESKSTDSKEPEISAEKKTLGRTVYSNLGLQTALQAKRRSERPFEPLAEEIKKRRREHLDVAVVVSQKQRLARMRELLLGYELDVLELDVSFAQWREYCQEPGWQQKIVVLPGTLSEGFRVLEDGFHLISDREIFPEIKDRKRPVARPGVGRFLGSSSQLKDNEHVVHIDYGIGIYRGLKEMQIEGAISDFLELEYAEGAKLFVPVENIGRVQKYTGVEGRSPKLTKLGGQTWEKQKKKVQQNVAELAGQLLHVIAQREVSSGFSFGPPDAEDRAFADSFPFEETLDQQAAIDDVLADMQKPRPMDRLVCGDVGYGKTEVALRAAFKAANSGKQTAVLVPTTILADQHFATFCERFEDSAISVACISRFYSSAQNKETLQQLAAGKVDIVIGTHRLLQKDVQFKDLGLVIVDEEHRFGVAHKERLKRYRAEIDVLTMTATPIPRTLQMSLTGIRELSLIETPPVNRQVIRTYLAPYEERVVREAITRELGRGGQVFYIYNRVHNINLIADELREIVPEARIGIGHGQMKERELEKVMHSFIQHELDILVSTTIVESGLDIPNANTIVVRNADMFGLAELYQLRGRVGRGARRAYAYLLVSDPKTLGPEARKRLQVLQSLDDLGVGFRLALQDMEIRGAGNLLGKDQSGQVNTVGYELYSRILKEAVIQLKRKSARQPLKAELPEVDPDMQTGFPAHIPVSYIPDVAERLLLYQKLIELTTVQDAAAVKEEVEDRFGRAPEEVLILLELMSLRALLKRSAIDKLVYRNNELRFSFHSELKFKAETVRKVIAEHGGALQCTQSGQYRLSLPKEVVNSPEDLEDALEGVLGGLLGSRVG